MNHPTIMQLLKLFVCFVSIPYSTSSFCQEKVEPTWKIGLQVSPNFAYQQRSTPRNRAIQMRPAVGVDFGVSFSKHWKDHFLQIIPSFGVARNKTKSSLKFDGFNIKYLFGTEENRLQTSLLYGKTLAISPNLSFQYNVGANIGYGFFSDAFFQDLDYSNEEKRLKHYFICASSGIGISKNSKTLHYYWGVQINHGLLSYTKTKISIGEYQTDFLSKGSSVNLVQIIYLKNKKSAVQQK